MFLSLIIPAFNSTVDVLHCLDSLQATAADNTAIQWLVQDDASPDLDFRKLIPPYAASVARNEANKGFAGNCNAGAARAQGDVFVFCNQDIEANAYSVGWDTAIRAAFEGASVGIVGARLLFPPDDKGIVRIQSVGGEFDAHLQPYHRCIGYSDLTHWEISERREVAWTTAAFLAIRRDVFAKAGGFDERYVGGYFEDTALCMKVRELGFSVWYEPNATFTHKVGSSGGNPRFMDNAKLFKQEWVDTRKVKPDIAAIRLGWW